jgi:hypothetical protein
VFEFSFVTLSVAQGEHSEPALENDIKFWEKRAATDPTTDHAQEFIRSSQHDLDWVRAEREIDQLIPLELEPSLFT